MLEMVNKMLTAKFSSTIINGFPTTTINGKDKMWKKLIWVIIRIELDDTTGKIHTGQIRKNRWF